MHSKVLLALGLAATATAHFELQWPPAPEHDSSEQGDDPCGGATIEVSDDAPEIEIDRFAVSVTTSHNAGNWRFQATLDTEAPYNWTEITPMVATEQAGSFCLTYLHAPEGFAGNAGILQVTDYSSHGSLYQCAPVRFVEGSNTTVGDSCSNSTSGFTASWLDSDEASNATDSHDHSHGDEEGETDSDSDAESSESDEDSAGAMVKTSVGVLVGALGLAAALVL